jgi:hypothetical protein
VNDGALASQQLANPMDTSAPGVDAYIGGHPVPKVVQGFQGTIFEVIGVGDSMADADFAKLWAYAQKRYGIK